MEIAHEKRSYQFYERYMLSVAVLKVSGHHVNLFLQFFLKIQVRYLKTRVCIFVGPPLSYPPNITTSRNAQKPVKQNNLNNFCKMLAQGWHLQLFDVRQYCWPCNPSNWPKFTKTKPIHLGPIRETMYPNWCNTFWVRSSIDGQTDGHMYMMEGKVIILRTSYESQSHTPVFFATDNWKVKFSRVVKLSHPSKEI